MIVVNNQFKSNDREQIKRNLNEAFIQIIQLINYCKDNQIEIYNIKKKIDYIMTQLNSVDDRLDIIRQFKSIQELDCLTVNTLIDYIEVGGSKNHRIINTHWNI